MTHGEPALYVYALAEPGLPRKFRIGKHSLQTLSIGSIAAVVERRPGAPRPTVDAVQEQHDVVVQLARRSPALLPARFGSHVSEHALRALIDDHRVRIAETLEAVRGRWQMTIRVFGTPHAEEAGETAVTSGTEFLERRRARAHHVPPEVEVVRDTVGAFTARERVEAGQGGLRVTVFHLVAAEALDAYRRAASRLQSLLTPHRVVVSGPWPVFAFTPELF